MFKLSEEGPSEDQVEEETDITSATHWLLPNGMSLPFTCALIILVVHSVIYAYSVL